MEQMDWHDLSECAFLTALASQLHVALIFSIPSDTSALRPPCLRMSRGRQPRQHGTIAQCNPPRARQRNGMDILQLTDGTGDGFDREPEKIRDVLARHRQRNLVGAAAAAGHFHQEGSDAFLCALDQQQHVIMSALQLTRGRLP